MAIKIAATSLALRETGDTIFRLMSQQLFII